MKIPSMPQKGGSVEHSIREIINFVRASRIVSVRGGLLRESPNGTTIQIDGGRGGPSTPSSGLSTCAFGEIMTIPGDPPTKGVRGGLIQCGDQNWNMDPQELNLATPGVWLVSIAVVCTSNTDDDGEIFLPGVETGTRPTGSWTNTAWTEGTDYPENTAPSLPAGTGTIILPIGKLTIAGGVATIEATGCGGFVIGQCAGTLSYSRE